jgi:hypothetical protein
VLAAIRAEHPGKAVELIRQGTRLGEVTFEHSWGLAPWVWPRFAAKVALGVLSLTMPPAWRGSDGELFLLALFRAGKVISTEDGISATPTPLCKQDMAFALSYPWEHTIIVDSKVGAVCVTITLFGELQYRLAVATEFDPVGPVVWVCDHRDRDSLTFSTIGEYAQAVTERFAHFGNLAGLRQERPRGRLLGPRVTARLRPAIVAH